MPGTPTHPPSPSAAPAALSIVINDSPKTPRSHHSLHSAGSASSDDTHVYPALDSTAALILVHDDDDDDDDDGNIERPLALDFSTDDEDDDMDDSLSPLYQINGRLTIPPLPPLTIFLYLLSPYLKLGALLLPYYQLPLKYGLSGILVSAVLAIVARHLLYLLARYLRQADLEEVVSSTFVGSKKKGRRVEKRKGFFKFFVKFGTGLLRILIAVTYLRECVLLTLPLLTSTSPTGHSPTELVLALTFVVLALLLSYPKSLASRLVIYTTQLSVLAYLLWLAAIVFLHTQGTLPMNHDRWDSRNIWCGIVTTAFIFTSSNTLPLYASTKGTIQPLLFDADTSLSLPSGSSLPASGSVMTPRRDGSMKQPWYRSFKLLSLLSVATALGLILPLVGLAAFPNEIPGAPESGDNSMKVDVMNGSIGNPEQIAPAWELPFPPGESPATRIQTYITPVLASLTLLFGIPQLLITVPAFPPSSLKWSCIGHLRIFPPEVISKLSRWSKKSALGLSLTLLILPALTLDTSGILKSLTVTLSLFATFYVPPTLHVFAHTFKSPLSIILPSAYFPSRLSTPSISHTTSTTPLTRGPEGEIIHSLTPTTPRPPPQPTTFFGWPRHRHTQSQQEHDDLLQRKERALQRRQMRRRIVWDVWAWALFFGGLATMVWGIRVMVEG